MNKLNRIVIMTSVLLGCNLNTNTDITSDPYQSENLDLPICEMESLIFKSICAVNDTIITVFLDKGNNYIINSYFVNSLPVKTDTLSLRYPIVGQSDVQIIGGKTFLIYTPQDSIKLSRLSPNEKLYFTEKDFVLSNRNQVVFTHDTKLVTNAKNDANNFEYPLSAFSGDSEYPITGSFDFEKNEVKLIGINYPEKYVSNYYGFLQDIQEVYTDSLIIYNPIALPELWVYNRFTKSVEVIDVKSRYQIREVDTIRQDDKTRSDIKTILEKHCASNGNYTRLIYNSFLNCYYRFYQHPQPLKTADGYFSTYQDRLVSCMKLNENFEPISEILLPVSCFFIYAAVPTKEGFVINRGALFDEGKMQLLEVKL